MSGYGQLGRRMGTSIGSFFGGGDGGGGRAAMQEIAMEQNIAAEQQRMALLKAKAQREQEAAALNKPDARINRVLMTLGVPTDAAPDVMNLMRTGNVGRFDPAQGPAEPAPAWLTPDLKTKVGQLMYGGESVLSGEAQNLQDVFKGFQEQTQGNLQNEIASGRMTPAVGGERLASMTGKPVLNAEGGMIFNQFSGAKDETGQKYQSDVQRLLQMAAQAKAAAAENYAQAGSANANRDRIRQEIDDPKLQFDSARGVAFNPRTGDARQVTVDGKPLTPRSSTGRGGGGSLPAAALKMQQEEVDALNASREINTELEKVDKRLTDGSLSLGPVKNLVGKGLNLAGASTENSRNLASFQATLEKLRNESLRLNKGVQTEGDAVRAWNELFSNVNDQELVKQRLAEIKGINTRATTLRQNNIDMIRRNYGADELDVPAADAPAGGVVRLNKETADAEYAALPVGAKFISPDGRPGTKR